MIISLMVFFLAVSHFRRAIITSSQSLGKVCLASCNGKEFLALRETLTRTTIGACTIAGITGKLQLTLNRFE